MRSKIKRRLGFFAVGLSAAFSALFFCACGSSYERYEDGRQYVAGENSVAAENIGSVEIDWLGGDVSVVCSASAESLSFSETYPEDKVPGAGLQVHSLVRGGKLEIRFAASGASVPRDYRKDLTVTLPAGKKLDSLEIENVSGDVKVSGVTADRTKLESVSGTVGLENAAGREISLDSESGAVTVRNVNATDISLETDSGSVSLEGVSFTELDVETVSGGVEWRPLANLGFTLEFRTVGGQLNDRLGMSLSGTRYVFGDGFSQASIETVSGNLLIGTAD